jgi:PAS domain S-box-containing protein
MEFKKMKNPFIVENTITHEKIIKSLPVDEEVFFDGGVMITETDTKGIITYANRKFREMTGFSREELIGSPHSINRHPDMPKGAFRGMWKIISAGKYWRGYVKNMCKDGRFYWVLVYIQPKYDDKNKLIGFVAGRKIPYPESVKDASELYAKFHGDEHINNEIFFDEGYDLYLKGKTS